MATKELIVAAHRLERKGGMEESLLEVLIHLARRGWQIELYSFRLNDWPNELPIVWHRISGYWLRIQWIKELWYRWQTAKKIGKQKTQSSMSLVLTNGTALTEADVRIVHYVHQAFSAVARKQSLSLPNASTPLRRFYQRLFAQYNIELEKQLLPRSKKLIAVSEQVARDVRTYIESEVSLSTIAHGQKKIPESSTVRSAKDSQESAIVFAGAFERKGLDKALRILAKVTDLSWKFQILGEGDRSRWQEYASRLGIEDRIEFVGLTRAIPYFEKSDILLFPSYYEPFGLVVAEAAMVGCVPLASNECGALELWTERPDWLKLGTSDPDAHWANSLRRLIDQPQLRIQLAVDAKKSFESWTWQKAGECYERVLEACIEQPTSTRNVG